MTKSLFYSAGVMAVIAVGLMVVQQAKPQPSPKVRITWQPDRYFATVVQGTAQSGILELAVSEPLSNVSIFVTPSIADFVSTRFEPINDLVPGRHYQVSITVEAPLSLAPGMYTGTIHLRSGAATRPSVLPVLLQVNPPSTDSIPPTISRPSSDRIITMPDGQKVVKDQIVVSLEFDTSNPEERIRQIASQTDAVIVGSVPGLLLYQLRYNVTAFSQLEGFRLLLATMPDVESANLSFFGEALSLWTLNDQKYADQIWDESIPAGNNWNLELIRALSAWDLLIHSGDPEPSKIEIGIIDAGFLPEHEDLEENIDLPVLGVPFSPSLYDHGTQVAGIIAGIGNNSVGFAGVAWPCNLSLKLYDYAGVEGAPAESIAEAMYILAQHGARVVNVSLGTSYPNETDIPDFERANRVRLCRWSLRHNRHLQRSSDGSWQQHSTRRPVRRSDHLACSGVCRPDNY